MKAVFITESGVYAYNMAQNVLTEIELDDCTESRIEIIADLVDTGWVNQLTDCIVTEAQPYSV